LKLPSPPVTAAVPGDINEANSGDPEGIIIIAEINWLARKASKIASIVLSALNKWEDDTDCTGSDSSSSSSLRREHFYGALT
jgi:hypothetical protein